MSFKVSPIKWEGHERHSDDILAAIDASRAATGKSTLGVGGTWAGTKDLFNDNRCDALHEWLRTIVPSKPEHIDAWGVAHSVGDVLAPHDHINSQHGGVNEWAGVYFMADGTRGDGLCFEEQKPIKPAAGHAVIFPANLIHWTKPAKADRLSIAFNVRA